MKRILIPTDFSQNSKKATDYALSLFNDENTVITLLNTFFMPYSSTEFAYSVSDTIYENAKKLFERERSRIEEKFPNLKASFSTIFKIGDVVSIVCSMEREEEYDLIVMGTKGASGMAQVFVGSRTAEMIANANTTVLAIPEKATFKPPKHILFAADEILIDRKVNLNVLKVIANQFQSKINALYIANSDENKEIIAKFINYELDINFIDIPHDLKTERGHDIEYAIKSHVENHPTDMVAMITTKGNLFHNLFHHSVTKQVAMHTNMPLLVMHTNLLND